MGNNKLEEIISRISQKPYYQDNAVVIYNADCRDILPQIPDKSIDLVLTDPPYPNLGDGFIMPPSNTGVGKSHEYKVIDRHLWNDKLDWLIPVWQIASKGMMIFCSFHSVPEIAIGVSSAKRIALVSWYERNSPSSVRNRPHYMTQYVWLLEKESGLDWRNLKTHYDIPKLAAGCMATERILNRDGSTAHPAQKPNELITELLKSNPDIVIDPFLGSGTTAYCAKKLGRKCIGIEIEEKYCRIAADRCRQSVMDLSVESKPEIKQEVLI